MHYVIPDIHNDNRRFRALLDKIGLGADDRLILLGDLFDRCSYDPDPVGVYFTALRYARQCTIVSGNHERWLAGYIRMYFSTPERERGKLMPYSYNSFDLMRQRLTRVDMLALADWMEALPLQTELVLGGQHLLFAHARTSALREPRSDSYYLTGGDKEFYSNGTDGYISFCGHTGTGFLDECGGEYLDDEGRSIWRNARGNVYMMDCGCGFSLGRLSCLCLETMERVYIP